MNLVKCDGCQTVVQNFTDESLAWLEVESELEREHHFCTWTCLVSYGFERALEQEEEAKRSG